MIKNIGRRTVLKAGAFGLAAASTSSMWRVGTANAAQGTLRIMDAGGVWEDAAKKAFYEPFQAASGINVQYASGLVGSIAQLKAMVDTGVIEWDIIDLSMPNLIAAGEAGLLEPIDYSEIDTAGWTPGSTTKYGFGFTWNAHLMSYNTEKYTGDNVPKTPADFWDFDKFPGKRSLGDRPFGTLQFALLADGVEPEKLIPLDFERAFKKLDAIKDRIQWWTAFAQQTQFLIDREVDMIAGYSGRFQSAIDKGAPYAIAWDKGLLGVEGWGIPKGSPNRKAAQEFLKFCARAKAQAAFSSMMGFGPSNPKAFDDMDPARARQMPNHPDHLKGMVIRDSAWIGQNASLMTDKWQEWKLT